MQYIPYLMAKSPKFLYEQFGHCGLGYGADVHVPQSVFLVIVILLYWHRFTGEYTRRDVTAPVAGADIDAMTQAAGSKFNPILAGN